MKRNTIKLLSAIIVMLMLLSSVVTGVSAATYFLDDGFKFTKETDGTVTIHEYVGSGENVSVPTTLLNKSVNKIFEYAFMNNTVIKSMIIPTSVAYIDRGAFYGCTSLESVQLPRNCTIGQYMFYGCTSLTSVILPSMLKEVPRYCFSRCDSLESVSLPSTAKVIGDYAFSDCPELKSVYVSRYTNSISDTAFEDSPQAVIYGYMDTYAYEYAMERSIPFCAVDADPETYYVTFYNYDGSIFQSIPVSKGNSISFPSAVPVKPSTATHYYEFSYWSGNVVNIQQHEFLYPVFEEREIEKEETQINTYSVVFLNGDDVFIDVQTVEEGNSAVAPSAIPTKSPSKSHTYVFEKWDTDFSSVTENLIVRPVFSEVPIEYKVVFLTSDGTVIEEQYTNYEGSVNAPEAPEIDGYTFIGWDKDFDCVTENMTVTAQYEKNKAEVALPTTGALKIEITGGTGFSIAVNGSSAKPQGTTYINSKMPVGTEIAVTAQGTDDAEFLGWVNPANGTIITNDITYTFISSGNDYFKAMYSTDLIGVQMVAFVNTKSGSYGRYLDVQYYSTEDEISFPEAPVQVGFDFVSWSMTESEIKEQIAKGEDVTVVANWTRQNIPVEVTVQGGSGSGIYNANFAVTAVADKAAEGMKFAYWTDEEGKVKSYNKSYKFYPFEDTTLIAVYVEEDAEIDKQILVSVDTIDTVSYDSRNVFYYSWYVPETYEFVDAGILAVNKENYNPATFYAGTTDANVYDRGPGAEGTIPENSASWTKNNVTTGQVWVAKAYVQYKDSSGNIVTIYSELVEAEK